MVRMVARVAGLVGAACLVGAVVGGCGSDKKAAGPPAAKVPADVAQAAVAARVTGLFQAAGLAAVSPVDPHLAACNQQATVFSVGAVVRIPVAGADDAKAALTKVHDYMGANGYTAISMSLDGSSYVVSGSVDGQTWGIDYNPAAAKELRFQGGTGCEVMPKSGGAESSAPRPSST